MENATFTTKAAVETPRLRPIDVNRGPGDPEAYCLISPDEHFAMALVRCADLSKMELRDTLYLWDVAELKGLAAHAIGRVKPPRILYDTRFKDEWVGISNVRWRGPDSVSFVTQGTNGLAQVIIVNLLTFDVCEWTSVDFDIVDYDIVGDVTLVTGRSRVRPDVISVTSQSFYDVSRSLQDGNGPLQMHIGIGKPPNRFDAVGRPFSSFNLRQVWLSPDAAHAIVLAPIAHVSPEWVGYDRRKIGQLFDGIDPSDLTTNALSRRLQYHLLSIENRTTAPLMDAPAATLQSSPFAWQVAWDPMSRIAFVPNTLLPVSLQTKWDINEPSLVAARLACEKNNITSAIQPICSSTQMVQIANFCLASWDIEHDHLKLNCSNASNTISMWYGVSNFNHPCLLGQEESRRGTNIVQDQHLNRPPSLVIRGRGLSYPRKLFDPSPDLKAYRFGHTRQIVIRDRNGFDWHGALIYPPDYSPLKRYPFCLQTHGFTEDEFIIDGPHGLSTAFAARPLSSANFIVAQVQEPAEAITAEPSEGKFIADGWFDIVSSLSNSGEIDPHLTCAVGFSRTGFHALAALAYYPNLLRAVVVSDAVQFSYTNLLFVENDLDQATDYIKMSGGLPVRGSYDAWFDRSLLYRAARSHAAVRFEGASGLELLWESYVTFRKANSPTELVVYPRGKHRLEKAAERISSLDGTVDWFRFWVQGLEDADPKKSDQYARWRSLRKAV